jgi:hypothetical protein
MSPTSTSPLPVSPTSTSEEEQLKRHGRALLYAMALVHLLYLGLLKQPPPAPMHAESQYAIRAVSGETIG